MRTSRKIRIAAIIGAVLVPTILHAESSVIASENFVAAAQEITTDSLPDLVLAFETDPMGVANYLESEIAGRAAARNYITAMLLNRQFERLGRQWKLLFADIAALSEVKEQDGGVWFPRAKDTGF
ncbi:hypothetical protein HED51_15000 [Ochrobactrum grignonense]|nr:hypothetical protein [Brucella grignonensis]